MKAKTLMGMIACAGACVSLSAFGNTTNDWFSVGVSNNAIDPVNCSTNGAAVSIENSKIVLDNEYTTRLAITPAVGLASTNSTDVAKIDVTALLTPSSTNDLAVIDDAKAGFAVGVDDQNATNFYGFANGEWIKLTGDASNADTQDTTFSIVLDYRVPNVRFYLGNTLLASASDSSATAFTIAGPMQCIPIAWKRGTHSGALTPSAVARSPRSPAATRSRSLRTTVRSMVLEPKP